MDSAMKKFFLLFLVLPLHTFAQTDFDGLAWEDIRLDCTSFTEGNHPRIFLDGKDFRKLKKETRKSEYLGVFHEHMMRVAGESLNDDEPVEYRKDESGRRILEQSRRALIRIVSLSYAYRVTGKKVYLKKAEWNIRTVCGFNDWNPTHFLDVAEMAFGVAVGYDWLYKSLSPEVRELAASRLRDYAMEEAVHGIGTHVFKRSGNWNQVCIACLSMAAVAVYETDPELCMEVLQKGLEGNIPAAKAIYNPDGAFPEGPGYWEYGTCYQEYYLLLLEKAFGTDFGISRISGFDKTGWFRAFSRSCSDHMFNYADNGDKKNCSPGLWYLAYKFNCPEILYDELQFLEGDHYPKERRLVLALISAYKLGRVRIESPKGRRLYISNGINPLLVAKSGWDNDDLYLGLKAGTANLPHSHADVGSIVFDAFGTRWITDPPIDSYSNDELLFASLGMDHKNMSNLSQDSFRWKLFTRNNRRHSTLTVNDKTHHIAGFAPIVDSWDMPGRIGGKADISGVFEGELEYAFRSASIVDDSYLEVVDSLASTDKTPARVRWTAVVYYKPAVSDSCIRISDGTTTMVLQTDAPGAEFRTWSSNPADYPAEETISRRKSGQKVWYCGFEFDMVPSSAVVVTTTLSKE